MSEYDEPEEPDFQPPPRDQQPILEVKIGSYDVGRLFDEMLKTAIVAHVGRAVEIHVERAVKKAVDKLVKEISTATIEAHVKEALTKGWTKVNQWGEPIPNSTTTLEQVVREGLLAMSSPKSDGYNRPAISPITAIVTELAAVGIKEGLAPILAEAKEQLKTQLDLSIGKSLRLTLGELAKG